jgi:hypothetical protein
MKSYYYPIEKLPGISQGEIQLFKINNITNTQELLEQTKTKEAQQLLANKLQIHLQYIKKWTALADLARIKSVGCQYAGLILHSGIASVEQFKHTPVPRIHRQILKLQVATMQRRDLCPSIQDIQKWLEEAK